MCINERRIVCREKKITEEIVGKFGIQDLVTKAFATESIPAKGALSFARYPAVFNTKEDAGMYMEINGCADYVRYSIEELYSVNWQVAILITFDEVAEVKKETTADDLTAALILIRETCRDHDSCTHCPLRLDSSHSGCSVIEKRPEEWVLVNDKLKEADRLFI